MLTPGWVIATTLTKPRFRAYGLGIAFLFLLASLVVALYYFPVTYGDWWDFFRPAALSLPNPYQVKGVLNPPWTFVLLYPLALLPGRWQSMQIETTPELSRGGLPVNMQHAVSAKSVEFTSIASL